MVLVTRARKRQVFIGHIMRREGLEHLMSSWKLEGKQDWGRHKEQMIYSLAAWLNKEKTMFVVLETRYRRIWKLRHQHHEAGHLIIIIINIIQSSSFLPLF